MWVFGIKPQCLPWHARAMTCVSNPSLLGHFSHCVPSQTVPFVILWIFPSLFATCFCSHWLILLQGLRHAFAHIGSFFCRELPFPAPPSSFVFHYVLVNCVSHLIENWNTLLKINVVFICAFIFSARLGTGRIFKSRVILNKVRKRVSVDMPELGWLEFESWLCFSLDIVWYHFVNLESEDNKTYFLGR